MTQYKRGSNGQFAGSIATGRTTVPTTSDIPTVPATDGSRDAGIASPDPAEDYTALHAAFRAREGYYGPPFRASTPEHRIDVAGTGRVGEIVTDADTLTRVFGDPLPGDGYKVSTEWRVEFTDEDGSTVTATVYDWKNYSFDADDEQVTRPVGQYEWTIGGRDDRAAALVRQALHSLY